MASRIARSRTASPAQSCLRTSAGACRAVQSRCRHARQVGSLTQPVAYLAAAAAALTTPPCFTPRPPAPAVLPRRPARVRVADDGRPTCAALRPCDQRTKTHRNAHWLTKFVERVSTNSETCWQDAAQVDRSLQVHDTRTWNASRIRSGSRQTHQVF